MKKLLTLFLFMGYIFSSCSENTQTRSYGGSMTLKLQPNEVFINMTYKENNIWLITKDTLTGKIYAREKSAYGIWEGTITIEP